MQNEYWSNNNFKYYWEDCISYTHNSSSNNSLPSFRELDESLKQPYPPSRGNPGNSIDSNLFERIQRQIDSGLRLSYNSLEWDSDKFLNDELRARVIELADRTGQMNRGDFQWWEHRSGPYNGEVEIRYRGRTAKSWILLELLKPRYGLIMG